MYIESHEGNFNQHDFTLLKYLHLFSASASSDFIALYKCCYYYYYYQLCRGSVLGNVSRASMHLNTSHIDANIPAPELERHMVLLTLTN